MQGLSEFADYQLQPLAKPIPWYLNGTKDFLQKVCKFGPPPSDWMTLTSDMSFLYTNFLHDEGVEACKLAILVPTAAICTS